MSNPIIYLKSEQLTQERKKELSKRITATTKQERLIARLAILDGIEQVRTIMYDKGRGRS
jgi:ribosome recycling factor